jgi:hypothetical protein
MNQEKKLQLLREVIEDTFWMAIRYAHGRHTYAPDIIREAIVKIKQVFPDFQLKEDKTLEPPSENELYPSYVSRKDWLDDLFKKKVK